MVDTSGTSAPDGLVLEMEAMSAGYEGVAVVHDLDLTVAAGEVVALLGANGAGKSTTLLAISGLVPALSGEIRVDGAAIGGGGRRLLGRRRGQGPKVRTAEVAAAARSGVAHVPEDRGLFFDLTVADHLRLGRPRRAPTMTDAEVWERFPALKPLVDRRAGLLSGGEQQMCALARALVGRPKLLLVDEMSLGLAPIIVERLLPVLRSVADDTGCAVMVVEQHVHLALEIADRAYLLQRGRVAASGSAAELAADRTLLEAGYLGDGTA